MELYAVTRRVENKFGQQRTVIGMLTTDYAKATEFLVCRQAAGEDGWEIGSVGDGEEFPRIG